MKKQTPCEFCGDPEHTDGKFRVKLVDRPGHTTIRITSAEFRAQLSKFLHLDNTQIIVVDDNDADNIICVIGYPNFITKICDPEIEKLSSTTEEVDDDSPIDHDSWLR